MSNASPLAQAATQARIAAKKERQQKFLSFLAEGLSITATCDLMPMERQTFYKWKDTDSEFRTQLAQVMDKRPETSVLASTFEDFRLRMFGMRTFWHQQKMIQAIQTAPDGGVTLILVPPEWGKTTLIEDWFCWRIGEDPDSRFVHMSQSQGHSRKIVGRLERRMLDEASLYYQRYGPFKSENREDTKPWNADFFTVAKSSHDERDYTLESRGGTSQIQGARADDIVLDDIQSGKTLTQTAKIFDHVRQEIVTRPGQYGHLLVVGTRIGFGDIYEAMLEADFVDKLVQIPALDASGKSNFPPQYDELGNPILDSRGKQIGWSEEALEQRRHKVGEHVWDRTYMQNPVSKMGMPFTEEAIQNALDRDRSIGDRTPGGWGILGALDPALGGHAAYIVAGYDASRMHIIDIRDAPGLGRVEQLLAILLDLTWRHHPNTWVIETESMQKGLARDQRLFDLAKEQGFNIYEHTTRGQKFDPAIGVASMAGAFQRGEIRIPYGDENTRREADMLIEQLRKWRPDVPARLLRQDLVMALWFAYLRWLIEKDNLAVKNTSWKRAGLPYGQPMGY